MDIKFVSTNNPNDIDSVCVAIAQTSDIPLRHHIGFLYPNTEDIVKFLHLAWHNDLRYEPPNPEYAWLIIPLDEINQIHFQAFLEMVVSNNKIEGIPYGISIDGINFEGDGTLTAEEEFAGLTCATFVMRALHSQGYQIIDFASWKFRDEDKVWQKEILNMLLCSRPNASEHVKYQVKKMISGEFRFKPEEIAIASHSEEIPLGLDAVQAPVQELINILDEYKKAKCK